MKESDGITICDRPTWALSFGELMRILGKRIVALPSKLIGFKPFCLLLATWLLVDGKIDMWVWFLVLVSVLFGIVGLKVATRYRGDTDSGGMNGGALEAVGRVAGGAGDGTTGSGAPPLGAEEGSGVDGGDGGAGGGERR